MNGLEWLLLAFAFFFIGVLVWSADEIEGFDDADGYNSEQGKRNDES